MWLLDANSLRLVSFTNREQTPRYAILSHTWSDDEVSFQDIMSNSTDLETKTGWSKIENACRIALSLRLRYVWIDTCCIDKSSSAELQEAINSMFKWHELAAICFAYLSDVSASEDHKIEGSSFRCSRWFKRGWTLQELIAPPELSFYDKDWKPMLKREGLVQVIEDITGIRRHFLFDQSRSEDIYEMLSTASVAERMSWMDERETTKPEDLAYCLLGIFDINMPMLYGEGPKAFQRLQEEIMKKSDDITLLSWDYEDPYSHWDIQEDSLLAPNPSSFRGCRALQPCPLEGFNAASFSMNQRGLQMEVPLRIDPTHPLLVYMILGCSPRLKEKPFSFSGRVHLKAELAFRNTECSVGNKSHKYFVAVPLISTSACSILLPDQGAQKGEYLRPRWCRPILVSEEFLAQAQSTSIIIRRPSEQFYLSGSLPISITIPPYPIAQGFTVLGIYPPQPIGRRMILVSPLARYIPSTRTRRRTWFSSPKIYSQEHQTMVHTRLQNFDEFIVVLGYRVEAWQHEDQLDLECRDINCRVFKAPENCDFEDLQRLSIMQAFTCLQEVRSVFQEDRYSFKLDFRVDRYLDIELGDDKDYTGATDFSITVIAP